MKYLINALFFSALAVAGNSFAVDSAASSKIRVPVKHIYVPTGFDSNDNVEVVVTGVLPNLCYYAPSVEVVVKGKTIKMDVVALHRNVQQNAQCPLVVVPFTLTARVGLLPEGEYQIFTNDGVIADNKALIKITEANTQLVDEFIYANVESVTRKAKTKVVTLEGYHPSDCYQLDRIETVSNGKDTIALLPIMKQVRDFCPMKMTPFKIKYTLPYLISDSEFLIHVRSMKGSSVNYLFMQK